MSTRSGFVAIVGPANAGKSTLLNAILGEKVSIVSRKQQSTRNRILGVKSIDDTQIVFFDTPGFLQKSTKGELSRYLNDALTTSVAEADLLLLVIDAAHASKDTSFVKKLRAFLHSREIKMPSIIVLNKIDLIDRRLLLPVIDALNKEFSTEQELLFIPLSASTGEGVDILIKELSAKMPEGPWYFPNEMVSDQTEEFLAAELIREAVFARVHQELPYSSAVRVTAWSEQSNLLKIDAQILVEKESQKGIVIGKRGAVLKAIGTSARIALEKRFRLPVYLELFVKVEPEWTKSKRGLMRAGYSS